MAPIAHGHRTPKKHSSVSENHDPVSRDDEEEAAERSARWAVLPARVKPEEMVEEIPANPPADPEAGRNPDRDWMLRYS